MFFRKNHGSNMSNTSRLHRKLQLVQTRIESLARVWQQALQGE
jgi:hypothetical protein